MLHRTRKLQLSLPTLILVVGLMIVTGCGALNATSQTSVIPTVQPSPSTPSPCSPGAPCIPGCGAGSAQWQIDTGTIACSPTGLNVTAPANGEGQIIYSPLQQPIPASYRIGLTADFSNVGSGCVSIRTTSTDAGQYDYSVCTSGGWIIGVGKFSSSNNPILLARGYVTAISIYHIVITVHGANRQLTINGVDVTPVIDATFTMAQSLALDFHNADTATAATAVFKDFVYTRL